MKLLPVILLLAVFAHSEVFGQFECYKCSGDGCNGEATPAVNCYDDEPIVPTTAGTATSSAAASEILLNNVRAISREQRAVDSNYDCYILKYQDGEDKTKSQKGCVVKHEGENPCDNVPKPANAKLEVCQLCSEPRCNSSPTIHLSILAIATALCIRYLV